MHAKQVDRSLSQVLNKLNRSLSHAEQVELSHDKLGRYPMLNKLTTGRYPMLNKLTGRYPMLNKLTGRYPMLNKPL